MNGMRHINMKESYVCEHHRDGNVTVSHVPGKVNLSDIFTKEHKDANSLFALHDCLVVPP
eukprot:963059-Ditylum_brightwellii.AAC.1